MLETGSRIHLKVRLTKEKKSPTSSWNIILSYQHDFKLRIQY